MANLYVAVVGLIKILENGTVLVSRTERSSGAGSHKIPIHHPRILFRSGGVTFRFPLNNHRVEIQIAGSGSFVIANRGDFLSFDELLDANGDVGTVNPNCVTGNCGAAAGSCRLPHGTLLPVEAYVDGAGDVHVDENITAKVVGRFLPTTGEERNDFGRPKAASGALFEASVGGAVVRLVLNGGSRDLEPGPLGEPRHIEKPTSAEDYIIWVENLPGHHHAHGAADIHFFLLYDFLSASPAQRWVPIIELPSGRVLPGSQCITPIKS